MDNLVPHQQRRDDYKLVAAYVVVSWVLLQGQIILAADSPVAEAKLEESAIEVSTRLGSQMSLYEEQIAKLETEFGPFHHSLSPSLAVRYF